MSPRVQLLFESLQKLLRRKSMSHAARLLERARPADVAVVLRFLDDRFRPQVFELLINDEVRAEVLSEMDTKLRVDLLLKWSPEEVVSVLSFMSPDDQADLLAELPAEQRQQFIDALRPDDAEEVEELLHYDRETAGGIMSPDYFALGEQVTAVDAIKALQTDEDVEMAFYVYVVNDHGHLVGVVSLRALVVTRPTTPLRELMVSDVICARVQDDQEEVARLAARYNLLAVPVVDESNKLVGIVTIDDVIDVIREEATEDILKMAGVDESAYEEHSLLRNFRIRAPWLFATWLGGLAASVLIGQFEHQLESTVALAAFIPIVLGMGGNVGTQTATIIVRGLATGQVVEGVAWRYLGRESAIGMLLGCFYGALLGLYTAVAYSDGPNVVALAATVGLSILASMLVAASVGACTPLIFHRLKIDPAVATGPIVTTTVDVLGILGYFLTAHLLLDTLG